MIFKIPVLEEIPAFYHPYIQQIGLENPIALLSSQKEMVLSFFRELKTEQWNYAYAEGKWTLAVLLRHMIDSEQVFLYRALCFSRNDTTSLPGFDENLWAETTQNQDRLLQPKLLLTQYQLQRDLTLSFFESIEENSLQFNGMANGNSMNANSIAYIIAGHEAHHLKIIRERYLKS